MKLSASLYAAAPFHSFDNLAAIAPFIDSWHVDIMDGMFAPAFGCNERTLHALEQNGTLPIDVHLMTERPLAHIERFLLPCVRLIAFHDDTIRDTPAIAQAIRTAGIAPYLALRPETAVDSVLSVLSHVDGLLILTAAAGGGAFSNDAFRKIEDVPAGMPIIVDGQIDSPLFPALVAADVALAVVGRALFSAPSLATRAAALKACLSG